jgi:exonuclease SbcC
MRIERVTVSGFGPLGPDAQLCLAPGMNVVFGPNESGKSSWHAAIVSGICGRPRSRGRQSEDARRFEQRYLPWSGARWGVKMTLVLDDGRRIEVSRLFGPAGSTASDSVVDLDLGRDISGELLVDRVPDAALLVGLDRSSFASTAAVSQADVLQVRKGVESLQRAIQRAATAPGADETAREALKLISEFRAERIGTERAPTRPLAQTRARLDEARARLDECRARHEEYLEACAEAEAAAFDRDQARSRLLAFRARELRRKAAALKEALQNAEALARNLGPDRPKMDQFPSDLLEEVATALGLWDSRPTGSVLSGRSAREIEKELASLPLVPEGDLEVDEEVAEAWKKLGSCDAELRAHEDIRPVADTAHSLPDLDPGELTALASTLDALATPPSGPACPGLAAEEHLRRLEGERFRSTVLAAIGGALLLVGALGAALVSPAVGALSLAGVGLLVTGISRRPRSSAMSEAREASDEARIAGRMHAHLLEEREARRLDVEARCSLLGVPADRAALRSLADQLTRRDTAREQMDRWQHRKARLEEERARLLDSLTVRLAQRGIALGSGEDPRQAYRRYEQGCGERALLARRAASRGALEDSLRSRRELEESLQDAAERIVDVIEKVFPSAEAERRPVMGAEWEARAYMGADIGGRDDLILGCRTPLPEEVEALRNWHRDRVEERRALAVLTEDWSRLDGLLGGRTLEALRCEAEEAEAVALAAKKEAEAALLVLREHARAGGAELDADRDLVDEDTEARLEEVFAHARDRFSRADEHRSHLEKSLAGGVAAAEESCAELEAQVNRLMQLDRVLDLAKSFLEAAEEDAYRTLAPSLGSTLSTWLPDITHGRYREGLVDLESLEVKVRDASGELRPADVLSHGTSEQVYLLLRVALVEHLTEGYDTCPLFFDEPTVHCDASRTARLLDLLHRLSADRQVVLFSQEEDVRAWGREMLDSGRDALVELEVA